MGVDELVGSEVAVGCVSLRCSTRRAAIATQIRAIYKIRREAAGSLSLSKRRVA